MVTKQCTKCGSQKDLVKFGLQGRGLHGRRSICKDCVSIFNKNYSAKRFRSDPDFREKKMQQAKDWARKNPEKRSKIATARNKKEIEPYPEKVRARALVNQRVRFGRIPRASSLNCSECGGQAAHYHHHLGYAFENRYAVVPVCAKCHVLID